MVNSRIVSRYQGRGPSNDNNRIIRTKEPLYPIEDILEILEEGKAVAWSKGCVRDMQKWEFDIDDCKSLIRDAIRFGQYVNSQWCQGKEDGPWAACDSYSISRREANRNGQGEQYYEYYVKFAIATNGTVLLMVSCHPEGA